MQKKTHKKSEPSNADSRRRMEMTGKQVIRKSRIEQQKLSQIYSKKIFQWARKNQFWRKVKLSFLIICQGCSRVDWDNNFCWCSFVNFCWQSKAAFLNFCFLRCDLISWRLTMFLKENLIFCIFVYLENHRNLNASLGIDEVSEFRNVWKSTQVQKRCGLTDDWGN